MQNLEVLIYMCICRCSILLLDLLIGKTIYYMRILCGIVTLIAGIVLAVHSLRILGEAPLGALLFLVIGVVLIITGVKVLKN